MGGRPKDPANPAAGGVDPAEVQDYFVRAGRYTAGVATRYRPGLLTGEGHWQHLATGLLIGARFHSAPVIRLADAKPVHLGHTACADGRWTLYIFADAAQQAFRELCNQLSSESDGLLRRITPVGLDIDSALDVRVVLQQPHRTIKLEELPELLLPRKGRYGLIDYEKTFTVDSSANIFDLRGIDQEQGAMVLVRPDQFVAHVLPLNGGGELESFLLPIIHHN
jgi:phenol 2-monooxygenase